MYLHALKYISANGALHSYYNRKHQSLCRDLKDHLNTMITSVLVIQFLTTASYSASLPVYSCFELHQKSLTSQIAEPFYNRIKFVSVNYYCLFVTKRARCFCFETSPNRSLLLAEVGKVQIKFKH